ncbi:hypothetical protein P3342_012357 [Pyrenophora teres f. teres]|nr:hypothetical protein P3342_012357 [Pyrenophora teres f. teres]
MVQQCTRAWKAMTLGLVSMLATAAGWTTSDDQAREGKVRDPRTVWQAELLRIRAALPRQWAGHNTSR